jgi:glutaredoxin-like YruB-family protein
MAGQKQGRKKAEKTTKKAAKRTTISESSLPDKRPKRLSDHPSVKIYSTQTCPFCYMAKDYLRSKNVKYEDIDVSTDEKAADEMIKKTGQLGVPVLEIGETIIIGFERNEIDKALSTKSSKKNAKDHDRQPTRR